MEALRIPRLSPVITLGFPLGSETQAMTVNVSVTRGHVRRTFENMIQVDTSLYRGNSGGPIIDIRGKVIGIASSVFMEWTDSPMPVATLLSDLGMVLPIAKATVFLQDLKAGQVKWNGVLDLSIDTKLKTITKLANQRRWDEAKALADKELELSLDPTLVMAAGMMHFCSLDYQGASDLFRHALSMDAENDDARLMLFLIDWLTGKSSQSAYRQDLLALDWRSPSEFFGHLVRVLEGLVGERSALNGGYSDYEKSWLHYAVGLILAKRGDLTGSEELLRKAVLTADSESWLFYLALSKLEQIQRQKMASLRNTAERTRCKAEAESFLRTMQKENKAKAERWTELAPLIAELKQNSITPGEKQAILERILKIDKTNGEVLVGLVYYSSMDESWDKALEYALTFLDIEGRENAGRLSIGLLQPEILHNIGQKDEARARLEGFKHRTRDPWYRAIGECLLAERTKESLTAKAGDSPEYLITAHVALGFWAEGTGDRKKASKHYKEALGSYMDDMLEFEFARERIKRLRQVPEGKD